MFREGMAGWLMVWCGCGWSDRQAERQLAQGDWGRVRLASAIEACSSLNLAVLFLNCLLITSSSMDYNAVRHERSIYTCHLWVLLVYLFSQELWVASHECEDVKCCLTCMTGTAACDVSDWPSLLNPHGVVLLKAASTCMLSAHTPGPTIPEREKWTMISTFFSMAVRVGSAWRRRRDDDDACFNSIYVYVRVHAIVLYGFRVWSTPSSTGIMLPARSCESSSIWRLLSSDAVHFN